MSLRTRLGNFLLGNKAAADTADTYRPGLSPIDMLNFGLVQPYIFQAYVYHENCSILCDIDITLTQETFRNGIGIEPRFVLRCRQCGHELQETADQCPSCSSDQLDEPLWAQQRFFEHLDGTSFLDRANYSGQTLQEVCENAAHHLHVADNGYLLAVKTYMFSADGSVKESFVKEIISLDPRWVEKVFDKRGVPGGRHRLCLAHRDALLGPEDYRCPECGRPTHDVTFKVVTSNNGVAYYVDDEIVHLTAFYPHPLYGTPPCYKILHEVQAYMYITGRVANYYKKGRAPGVIAVRTNNPKAIDETIKKVNLQLEKDPHAAPYFPVDNLQGSGEFMKWVPFMQDPCPDMMAVKDEVRRAICAFFGIPPMVESDTSASGGLNDEGHQITLLNRRTQREQAPFNNRAFPWMFKQFGITDLKLVLNKSEKADEKADMELRLLEDQHAQNLMNMGYDVWIEGGKYKHSDRPTEKRPPVFLPSGQADGTSLPATQGTPRPESGVPGNKGERCPNGQHSHGDYGGGRCHPEEQHHRDGERHEESERRGPRQGSYAEASEERRTASIKSIKAKGVKVENAEGAHHKVLEYVDSGLDEAVRHETPLPGRMKLDRSYAEKRRNVLGLPMAYDPEGDVLLINPDSIFLQAGTINLRGSIDTLFRKGESSTGSPLHIIRHELGHVANVKAGRSPGKEFGDEGHRKLAATVSKRAAEDPAEFVAEVFAGRLAGNQYTDEVMRLYAHYFGGK
jgi:DNA-directed RNA polymerase subunit RPC12/RpoP